MGRFEGIVGTSKQLQIVEPALDGVAITTADSTAWSLIDEAGTTLSSGTMTYSASLPAATVGGASPGEGWFANYDLPNTPQITHIHMTMVKSGTTMKWHDTVVVKDFR
jgi:hypothetical protein